MTKFSKRINKINRRARNLLVIGTAFGNLEELLDSFDTIFVVANSPPLIKKRNLIYRENYDDIHTLTDVDIIMVDFDHSNFIPELTQVWRRTGPAIVVQGPDLISKDIQKILKSDHYNIVEVAKGYYLWKNKK
jgi:hypothetical protein